MLKKLLGITTALILLIGLTACGGNTDTDDASASIGEKLDYTIVGIDPGAGLMEMTINTVLPEYGLDDKWEVQESSGAAMTAELGSAIENEEPIIVTGWIPHWKFFKYDLKMLDDPKGAFGGKEDINTLVRKGLKEDLPGAYTFFDQFNWDPDHLQEVMLKIENGMEEQEAAKEWVENNEELVNSWIEGAEPGNGAKVKVPYVAWADVIASSNVVKYVLDNKLDYNVELIQVEPGPMFASVADGSADAMVGAWLPSTHTAYYEKYKGDFEDLGVNLTGTRNGLVVPAYMDIDSIEDLME
ncbi:glycine betaine ABC transporter substrate-binding protein [Lentibacillus sp. Marseille-P4043]|uniref:glycine betaine ABC transporter substrate-binding protein n=1 Tax=Lentibacillus sp. Marseille-P4043 TaxID=2040293 RepID=UPI000D0B62D4|nr:glycine betaine ABC transporter substrate-binding protein [Lentibacillus sp. Marseille-P4043]